MRLQKYKDALEEAKRLPTNMVRAVPVIIYYDPRRRYVQFVLDVARKDEKLPHSEFVELYELFKQQREGGTND